MKALLLSCRRFETQIKGATTRPAGIVTEQIKATRISKRKSIVALVTVETGDEAKLNTSQLGSEIRKFAHDTGITTIVIFPFAHLSNRIAASEEALSVLSLLVQELKEFAPVRIHYGSHKSLLLDIHGHKGNVRWREF